MDTTFEERVYKNYRAAVVSATHRVAAARRQYARKVTVERYGVSYSQVKDIVARFDEVNGVTHEHTPQYVEELKLCAAVEVFNANPAPCVECGVEGDSEESTVRVRVDVRVFRDTGEKVYVPMCFLCHYWEKKSLEQSA